MGFLKELMSIKSVMNENTAKSDLLVEITPEEKEKLQTVIFEAYKDIKKVCEKYRLDLFLVGGSALGAVRHEGFIPWDDDIDLGMSRDHYNVFKKIFAEELGEKYILNSPNYANNPRNRFPIILIKDTYYRRLIDTQDKSLHRIPIDLFVIDNYPDNIFARTIIGHYCNFLEFVSGQVYLRENTNPDVKAYLTMNGSFTYKVRMIIGFMFSFKSSQKWFNYIDSLIQNSNNRSKYCGIITGRGHYFKEMMPRDVLFPSALACFNHEKVQVFHDIDYYLKQLYGDYMAIPPVEKRERHFYCELRFDRNEGEE